MLSGVTFIDVSFTFKMLIAMPWSATTEFSHPLVAVDQSNTPSHLTNYLTFAMAAGLTWQGYVKACTLKKWDSSSTDNPPMHRLGRTINKFRRKRLGLEVISLASGASVLDRLRIPYIYTWSSALIPKPKDWMSNIDITGFLFLKSPPYTPPPDLAAFLAKGPAPMYIGFGSIVVEDPAGLTGQVA